MNSNNNTIIFRILSVPTLMISWWFITINFIFLWGAVYYNMYPSRIYYCELPFIAYLFLSLKFNILTIIGVAIAFLKRKSEPILFKFACILGTFVFALTLFVFLLKRIISFS